MVFTTAGGGATQESAAYEIDNSLRFNDDDTAYLNRTRSSQSNTTGTFSVWTKMSNVNVDNVLFGGATDVNNRSYIYFSDPDGFVGIFSRTSGSADIAYHSNAKFRDPSAWYHVVVAIDTTQGTAGNRFKMYINGTQYTDWGTATAPSQNASLPILNQSAQTVGGGFGASAISAMAEGYMADAYYIDGQQLDASNFGETNDNGVWIPKNYTGSYGTNGFKLEFKQLGTAADATSIGADTSGNNNHFSQTNVTPAVDRTTDTPTNNFCTFNPLDNDTVTGAATFSEGNTVINANSDAQSGCPSTIAVSNGKWYIEGKCLAGTFEMGMFGYGDGFSFNLANHPPYGDNGYPFAYEYGGNLKVNNSNVQTGLATFTTSDILSLALDMDNNTIKFFKNGSQVGTTITDSNLSTFAPYTFYVANHTSGNSGDIFSLNTGNPSFSISSGNSDANGYGNFEYAPPTNYYSLCSKNLAEYG